ncbi:MAG: hypothetical protein JRN20_10950 [Nitrososphaerota archaeon]|nr:hypothetical protein [Nitrososphaerota archaeon]
MASISNLKKDQEYARRTSRQLSKRLGDFMINEINNLSENLDGEIKLYVSSLEEGLDSEYHLMVGDKLVSENPTLIYVALFEEKERFRILVFSGELAHKKGANAGSIVRELAKEMGGSGGGGPRFAQGGLSGRPTKIPSVRNIALNLLSPGC